MEKVSEFTKIKLIDYGPKTEKNIGVEEIIYAGGKITYSEKSFFENLKKVSKDKIKKFFRNSIAKGHASLLTTPYLYFIIEGSKLIDLYFSSPKFGSYLISSTRRIPIDLHNLIIPDIILENKKLKSIFEKTLKKSLELYKDLNKNYGLDVARNILPLCIKCKGLFSYSLQTLISMINEKKSSTFPSEILNVLDKLEKTVKEIFPNIYENLRFSHLTNYPFVNFFKNVELKEDPKIEIYNFGDLEDALKYLESKEWNLACYILRVKLMVKVIDFLSIGGANEWKRHRTVEKISESIYFAANRFLKTENENLIYIPKVINEKDREKYLETFKEMLSCYENLYEEIGKEAIYIIPLALKIKTLAIFNGWHIIHPFGFIGIRYCKKAHPEMREYCEKIIRKIKEKVPELSKYVGRKCKIGFCPEEDPCEFFMK